MRTTLFGLCAHAADFAMLCVDAPSSIGSRSFISVHRFFKRKTCLLLSFLVDTTREHLSYAVALDVPVFVVINKIDLCSEKRVLETVDGLIDLLQKSYAPKRLQGIHLKDKEQFSQIADIFVEKNIVPIFTVSCVSGENITLLKEFLNIIPPRLTKGEQEKLSELPVEFQVCALHFYIKIR